MTDTLVGRDALNAELGDFFSNAKTRLIRTIRQFCEEELVVADGPRKGPFRVDTQPAIGLWFDEIDSGRWNELIFTAPSQWGKTLVGFIAPALYHTAEMAENYILAVPDMRMGQNKWEVDLRPAFEASPSLRKLLPRSGEGSRGGKISDSITLNNGKIIKWMTAGGDDTQKAGFTSRIVGVTEAARFSESSDTSVESDPLRQLQARQRSYTSDQRRSYVEGTVTIEEELPWRARPGSSQSRILTPCPHCEAWIAPERDHLCGFEEAESEVEAAEESAWFCYCCGELITDEQRLASVRECKIVHGDQTIDSQGRVVGDLPKTRRLWFRATPWLNCLLSTADLAIDEWRSLQIDEDSPERQSEDKRMAQFVWCSPWTSPRIEDAEIDRNAAAKRVLEDHPRGVVPNDTTALVVGTDMGKHEAWWLTLAIREDGRRHVVDYGSVEVQSARMSEEDALRVALAEMSLMVHAGWQKADGEIYPVDAWWVDSGYKRKTVERYCRREYDATGKRTWCLPANGLSETKIQGRKYLAPKKTGNEVREIDPDGKYHVSWLRANRVYGVEWDADDGKLRVQNAMVIPQHRPGAMTLFAAPMRTHRKIIRHFTNERRILVEDKFKGDYLKFKKFGANHLLDCAAEADTAARRVLYLRERKKRAEQQEAVDASYWN